MISNSALFVGISAIVVILVSTAVWRYIGRMKGTIRTLQQEITALRHDRVVRPSPRISFQFDTTTREALLHITNDGGDARASASMSIEGPLANRLEREVSAVWVESGAATAVIPRGQTRTLRLAKLDLSVFPYAQWEIYAIGPREGGQPSGLRAMHSSMIGGDPETHAPTMFLQVALQTSPDAVGPPPQCTIALQAFDAVRLRPV